MELYIVNRIKKTTIRNYIDSYNRCIKYIGYMKLADIQITHVQNMVIELANKGYKNPLSVLLFLSYPAVLKEL